MPTFTQIGSAIVATSGSISNINFTSIPATYTDLCLKLSLRSSITGGSTDFLLLGINGTTSTFTFRAIESDGATKGSFSSATDNPRFVGQVTDNSKTANVFGNTEIYFSNYTSSGNKSYSVDSATENNGTTAYIDLIAGMWSNSAVINRITISPALGTSFMQYSSAYLYGVSNA